MLHISTRRSQQHIATPSFFAGLVAANVTRVLRLCRVRILRLCRVALTSVYSLEHSLNSVILGAGGTAEAAQVDVVIQPRPTAVLASNASEVLHRATALGPS